MSRSGYSDDIENWSLIRWRGAVASSLRGARGQAFLKEALDALDAMPIKALSAGFLTDDKGCACTLGAVGRARGMDMSVLDDEDHESVAASFGLAHAMACEIMWENDEGAYDETPEQRFTRMHKWISYHIKEGK